MRLPVLARALLTTATAGAALAVTWRLAGGAAVTVGEAAWSGRLMSDAWTLDTLVADLAAALTVVAVAGLALVVTLGATSVLLQGRARRLSALCDRVTPRACRRLVAAWCGIGLTAPWSLVLPASADAGAAHQPCHRTCRPGAVGLTGLDLPDLPTRQRRSTVVVRPGDSLWAIARGRLPAAASLADIATLTRRLYALNGERIGPDPDLILPGMTLVTPEGRS